VGDAVLACKPFNTKEGKSPSKSGRCAISFYRAYLLPGRAVLRWRECFYPLAGDQKELSWFW